MMIEQLNHINTLVRMLANIRKPYLNVDFRNASSSNKGWRAIDVEEPHQSWTEIRYLSNEERDQFDIQVRSILTRCADRLKEMEVLERRTHPFVTTLLLTEIYILGRTEIIASNINPITRLFSALKADSPSDFVAAHHSSITWYLSRRLAEASQAQKEMQEERTKRQLERTKTLGSGAAQEALSMSNCEQPLAKVQLGNSDSDNWLDGASSTLASGLAATLGTTSPNKPLRSTFSSPAELAIPLDDEDDEIELSPSQIQQFEMENADLLRSVQDTLLSVQQAESRLLDISTLQMELVTNLTRQTVLTDQLYEDAIASTSTVGKGNFQLREAKRRAKESRMFILFFLIGASLSLLFLHFY
jgi:syntaxin 18